MHWILIESLNWIKIWVLKWILNQFWTLLQTACHIPFEALLYYQMQFTFWHWVPSSLKLWNHARLLVTWLWGTALLPEFERTVVWYAETRAAICKCGSVTRLNPPANYRTRCGKHNVSIFHSLIYSLTFLFIPLLILCNLCNLFFVFLFLFVPLLVSA